MQILHGLEGRQQLRTNVGNAGSRQGLGIDHARALDHCGVLRGAVVVQVNGQAHQITISHQGSGIHRVIAGGSTSIAHHTGRVQQVNLQCVFGDFIGTAQHFTVDMLCQFGIRIKVQRFLGVLVKETKLLKRTLQLFAHETDTVHTATSLRQGRQLACNGAHVLGRTIQIASTLARGGARNCSSHCIGLGQGSGLQ